MLPVSLINSLARVPERVLYGTCVFRLGSTERHSSSSSSSSSSRSLPLTCCPLLSTSTLCAWMCMHMIYPSETLDTLCV